MRSKFGAIKTAKEKRIKDNREEREQIALFDYFRKFYPEIYSYLYANPNGGSRHMLEAANLKKQGVKSGIPDIHLPIASRGYHSLYIELKSAIKPAPVSDSQKEWLKKLEATGNKALVSYGWVKAANDIFYYLNRTERVK